MEKKALGRGLSALIPQKDTFDEEKETVIQIAINQIKTGKYQPRFDFNQEKLNDLISSIKEKGVIQPVLVRKLSDGYELIAGERRLRAAKALGFGALPAIVKDVSDLDMLEIALIENIQREGLNPIEEASAFQKFITEFAFTQEKIAQTLGKDRSTVANTLRLLGLPKKIQEFLAKGSLTTGHAKALLSLPNDVEQLRVANVVVAKSLSVRETEQFVSRRRSPRANAPVAGKDPHIADIEDALQKRLGTRVKIMHGKKRGRIVIDYYSTDDLNRIVTLVVPQR